MMAEGPFYPLAEAAKYCGYKADRFRKVLREGDFVLPRSGPGENRFAKSVLDAFMTQPDAFRTHHETSRKRRNPNPVKV